MADALNDIQDLGRDMARGGGRLVGRDPETHRIVITQDEEGRENFQIDVDVAELDELVADPADRLALRAAVQQALLDLGIGVRNVADVIIAPEIPGKTGTQERHRTAKAQIELLFEGMHMPVDLTVPPASVVIDQLRDRLYVILTGEQVLQRKDIETPATGVEDYMFRVPTGFLDSQFSNFMDLATVAGLRVMNYAQFTSDAVKIGFHNINAIYNNPAYHIIPPPGIDHLAQLGALPRRVEVLKGVIAEAAEAVANLDFDVEFPGHNGAGWWATAANRDSVYNKFKDIVRQVLEQRIAAIRVEKVTTKERSVDEEEKIYRRGIMGQLVLENQFGFAAPNNLLVPGPDGITPFDRQFINLFGAEAEHLRVIQLAVDNIKGRVDVHAINAAFAYRTPNIGVNWGGVYNAAEAGRFRDQIDAELKKLLNALQGYLRYTHSEEGYDRLRPILVQVIFETRNQLLGDPTGNADGQIEAAIWNDCKVDGMTPPLVNRYTQVVNMREHVDAIAAAADVPNVLVEINNNLLQGDVVLADRMIKKAVEQYIVLLPTHVNTLLEAAQFIEALLAAMGGVAGFVAPARPHFLKQLREAVLFYYAEHKVPAMPTPPGVYNAPAGIIKDAELKAVLALREEIDNAYAALAPAAPIPPFIVEMQEIAQLYCEYAIVIIQDDKGRPARKGQEKAQARLDQTIDLLQRFHDYIDNGQFPLQAVPPQPLPPIEVIKNLRGNTNIIQNIQDRVKELRKQETQLQYILIIGNKIHFDRVGEFLEEGWQERNHAGPLWRVTGVEITDVKDRQTLAELQARINAEIRTLEGPPVPALRQQLEARLNRLDQVAQRLDNIPKFVGMLDALVAEHDAAIDAGGNIRTVGTVGTDAEIDARMARAAKVMDYGALGVGAAGLAGAGFAWPAGHQALAMVGGGVWMGGWSYAASPMSEKLTGRVGNKLKGHRIEEDAAADLLRRQAQAMINNGDIAQVALLKDPVHIQQVKDKLRNAMLQLTRINNFPAPPDINSPYVAEEYMIWTQQLESALDQIEQDLGRAIDDFVMVELEGELNALWAIGQGLQSAVDVRAIGTTNADAGRAQKAKEDLQFFIDVRNRRMGLWNKVWRGHAKLREITPGDFGHLALP